MGMETLTFDKIEIEKKKNLPPETHIVFGRCRY